jgi:hypothetical protein
MNYEGAFRQTGRLTLVFEALVDFLTVEAMFKDGSVGGVSASCQLFCE